MDPEAGKAHNHQDRTARPNLRRIHSAAYRRWNHSSEGVMRVSTGRESDPQLDLLKTEIGDAFPDLLQALEKGIPLVLISGKALPDMVDPDSLRRIGGIVLLCQHYGASTVFLKNQRHIQFRLHASLRN
jgi:hypothetical protein